MKNNKINNRQGEYYKEYGSGWTDSVAYITDKVIYSDDPILWFYKFYRSNISRGMLEMYHHIHHYLSQKNIPICPVPGQYNDEEMQWERKWVKFEILDLDPKDINIAWNRDEDIHNEIKKWQIWYITHPKYIEGQYRLKIFPHEKKEDREYIWEFLTNYLRTQGIYTPGNDPKNNFSITWVDKDGLLHIVVTDLAAKLAQFCAFNEERASENIPERKSKNKDTVKSLFNTLAQNETIENTNQNTTTQ